MSYQIDDHYFMIFPLAKYDMLEFWKTVPNNPTCPESLNWVLTQCYGLARGLQKIHKHDATLEEKSNKYMGRHGDIKPQNILCFDSPGEDGADDCRDVPRYRLVLADFTFMRFHSPLSCEHSTESAMRYTHTYRPPETCSDHGNIFSQKHDVWTLGCVYLEFITWHLLGHDAIDEKFSITEEGQVRELQGFRTMRDLEDAIDDRFVKDTFFNLDKNRKAHLKESVPKVCSNACVMKFFSFDTQFQWCSYLRERKSCSPQLCDFIDFIQEHMLVVELDKRRKIDFVCTGLNKILNDENSARIRQFSKVPGDFPPLYNQEASYSIQVYSVQVQSGFRLLMGDLDYKATRGPEERPEKVLHRRFN
jgi:serine/threonine protein kinase